MNKHDDLGFVADDLGFVPDEQSEQEMSTLKAGALGAAKGATFGFADEVAGALQAAPEMSSFDINKIKEAYGKGRKEYQALEKQAEEEHPYATFAGELAGGAALPLGALGAAGKTATLGQKMLKSAKLGAGLGATLGLGQTEDITDLKQTAKDVAGGALGGAVMAPAAELAIGATGSTLKGAKNYLTSKFEKPLATEQAFNLGKKGVDITEGVPIIKEFEKIVKEDLTPALEKESTRVLKVKDEAQAAIQNKISNLEIEKKRIVADLKRAELAEIDAAKKATGKEGQKIAQETRAKLNKHQLELEANEKAIKNETQNLIDNHNKDIENAQFEMKKAQDDRIAQLKRASADEAARINKKTQEVIDFHQAHIDSKQQMVKEETDNLIKSQVKDIDNQEGLIKRDIKEQIELDAAAQSSQNIEERKILEQKKLEKAEQLQSKINNHYGTLGETYNKLDDQAASLFADENGKLPLTSENAANVFKELSESIAGRNQGGQAGTEDILKGFKNRRPIKDEAGKPTEQYIFEPMSIAEYKDFKKYLSAQIDINRDVNPALAYAYKKAYGIVSNDFLSILESAEDKALSESYKALNKKWQNLNALDSSVSGIEKDLASGEILGKKKTIQLLKSYEGMPAAEKLAAQKEFEKHLSGAMPEEAPGIIGEVKGLGEQVTKAQEFTPNLLKSEEVIANHPEYEKLQEMRQLLEKTKASSQEKVKSLGYEKQATALNIKDEQTQKLLNLKDQLTDDIVNAKQTGDNEKIKELKDLLEKVKLTSQEKISALKESGISSKDAIKEEKIERLQELRDRLSETVSGIKETTALKKEDMLTPKQAEIQALKMAPEETPETFLTEVFGSNALNRIGTPELKEQIYGLIKGAATKSGAKEQVAMEKLGEGLKKLPGITPEKVNEIMNKLQEAGIMAKLHNKIYKEAMLTASGTLPEITGGTGASLIARGANIAGLTVNKFANSPEFQYAIPRYAKQFADRGMTKYAGMLEKINAAPLQKQKALLYTLMQDPSFRNTLKEMTPGLKDD